MQTQKAWDPADNALQAYLDWMCTELNYVSTETTRKDIADLERLYKACKALGIKGYVTTTTETTKVDLDHLHADRMRGLQGTLLKAESYEAGSSDTTTSSNWRKIIPS